MQYSWNRKSPRLCPGSVLLGPSIDLSGSQFSQLKKRRLDANIGPQKQAASESAGLTEKPDSWALRKTTKVEFPGPII